MSADRQPSIALRRVISVLLILHFAAIGVAVTGASSGRFSAPPILAEGHQALDPYLQPIFLGHSYRFFAPNPSVDPVLWARVRFADGGSATIEFPHLRDRGAPVAYMRDFSIPSGAVRVKREGLDEPATLSLESEVLIRSTVRRFAKFVVPDTFPDSKQSVETIDLYLIERQLPTPDQIRTASRMPDLSLHTAIYLGRFTDEGTRRGRSNLERIPLDSVLVTVIERDITPSLKTAPYQSASTKYSQRWPTLIDVLVERKPDLFRLPAEELGNALKKLNSHPNSEVPPESHSED